MGNRGLTWFERGRGRGEEEGWDGGCVLWELGLEILGGESAGWWGYHVSRRALLMVSFYQVSLRIRLTVFVSSLIFSCFS